PEKVLSPKAKMSQQSTPSDAAGATPRTIAAGLPSSAASNGVQRVARRNAEPDPSRILEPQCLPDDMAAHCMDVAVRARYRAGRVQGVDAARGIRRVDGGFGDGGGMQRRTPHRGDFVERGRSV